jgi:uncharacterized protein HemY
VIELLLQAEGALSLGLLDRAETLYGQVAGADPRNSMAVVGLARVALERRDEAGALAFARRALAIDPQNTAARRMVLRLEEVLRYRRGEAPAVSGPEPGAVSGAEASPPAQEPTAAVEGPRRRSVVDRLLRRR